MQKDKLTLANIQNDLDKIAYTNISNVGEWRSSYYIPITILAVMVGVLLKNIWVGLLIFSVAAYHIVMNFMEYKKYAEQKKAIKDVLDRGDISISVEKLSHISVETIYEPHTHSTVRGSHTHATKEVTLFYFESGVSWRVPKVDKHYEWSSECYLSSIGLINISVSGNEFFYVTLQGHHEIAYVYPCKLFELDERLRAHNFIS